jgi:hypothetical protein
MAPLSERDKRALLLLAAAVVAALALQYGLPSSSQRQAPVAASSIQLMERRLQRLQEQAKRRPAAAAEAESAARALAETEKGLLKGATPALASAEMQEIMKELLRSQGIGMQSSEFGTVKAVDEDYAQVPLTVGFSCGIEQWVNLMAALRNAPQILSPVELRINQADPKNKWIGVHMTVAGYIRASSLPAAKGAGTQ